MPSCTFHIVDAFTVTPFTGNPCAVVTDADGIEPADMVRIARETNTPETAFVLASDKADVRVRYFMPRGEIPFAGHPTIATGHLLRELGMLKPGAARFEFSIGVLPRDHPRQGGHDQPPAIPDRRVDAAARRRKRRPCAVRILRRASVPAHARGQFRWFSCGNQALRRIARQCLASRLSCRPGVSAAYARARKAWPERRLMPGPPIPDNAGEDPFTGIGRRAWLSVAHGLCPGTYPVEQLHLSAPEPAN